MSGSWDAMLDDEQRRNLLADLERVREYLGTTYYLRHRLTSAEHDDAVQSIVRVQSHLRENGRKA